MAEEEEKNQNADPNKEPAHLTGEKPKTGKEEKDHLREKRGVRFEENVSDDKKSRDEIRPDDDDVKDLIGNIGIEPARDFLLTHIPLIEETTGGILLPDTESNAKKIDRVTILRKGEKADLFEEGDFVLLNLNRTGLDIYSKEHQMWFYLIAQADVLCKLDTNKE